MAEISCATRPRAGQSDCADRCGWWRTTERIVMAVADGLGHESVYAAEIAITCIGANLERSINETFAACDARLSDTHGVALSVAVVDIDSQRMTTASVGNIRTVLFRGNTEYHLGCTRGIVGSDHDPLWHETRLLASGDVLALFSDGLDAFFSLRETLESAASYSADPAQTVMDRWARLDNDAAILIYRHDARTIDQAIMEQTVNRFRVVPA